MRRPNHAEILQQVIACGLSAANVELFIDSDGIDNAHISPAGEPQSTYEAGVFCKPFFFPWC